MTDREAIDMLRYYSEHGIGEISTYEAGEIADILEDMLKNRIDREKGCGYCQRAKIKTVHLNLEYNEAPGNPERLNPNRVPYFCPLCGKPLRGN